MNTPKADEFGATLAAYCKARGLNHKFAWVFLPSAALAEKAATIFGNQVVAAGYLESTEYCTEEEAAYRARCAAERAVHEPEQPTHENPRIDLDPGDNIGIQLHIEDKIRWVVFHTSEWASVERLLTIDILNLGVSQ